MAFKNGIPVVLPISATFINFIFKTTGVKSQNFSVQFSYSVEELKLQLAAEVELHHSVPHYLVKNIQQPNVDGEIPWLPDISIKAVKTEDGLKWVHTDSERESILSTLIGREIEKTSMLDIT